MKDLLEDQQPYSHYQTFVRELNGRRNFQGELQSIFPNNIIPNKM
jgi:hypothetical protein